MSKAANRAKTKWNANNYVQVKVHVDPDVAAAFKSACQKADISMASVLSQFMAQYTRAFKDASPTVTDDLSTRKKRRKFVDALSKMFERVRDAEECYMFNIPENLQGSSRYDAAEQSVSKMDEVIDLIGDIY